MINLRKSIDQNMQSILSDILKVTEENYWMEIEQSKLMQSLQRMELQRSTYRRNTYYKNKDLQKRKVYRIYNKERQSGKNWKKKKKSTDEACFLFLILISQHFSLNFSIFFKPRGKEQHGTETMACPLAMACRKNSVVSCHGKYSASLATANCQK